MLLSSHLIGFGVSPVAGLVFATPASWTGATANYTLSGADVSSSTGDRHIRTSGSFAGDFTARATLTGFTAFDHIGFYDAAADASWSSTDGAASNISLNDCFLIRNVSGTPHFYFEGSSEGSFSHTAGDVYDIIRTGSTVKVYQNDPTHAGAALHTFTGTSSATLRLTIGKYSTGTFDIDNIQWSGIA